MESIRTEDNHDEIISSLNDNEKLYDYAPIGYLSLNEKGIIVKLNIHASELLGIENKSELGKLTNYLTAEEEVKFNELVNQCKQNNRPASGEFILIGSPKGILIINLIVVPLVEIVNEKMTFNVFFTDITDRKKAEKIVQESEKRFRIMADSSPVMLWMTDADNNLEYMNQTKLDFLGKKRDELTYETWLNTRHPEDRERFLTALSEAAAAKKNFSIEIRVLDRDGNYRWLIDSAAPRFFDNNTFAGFIGSGIDITERKKAEKVINDSEKLFRIMADCSPVMIWMTDAANNLEYMNETKLKFLGKTLDELTYETWLETRHPEDRSRFLAALSEAAEARRNFSIEIRVKDRDGNYKWIIDSAAPRFRDDKTFAGFIGSGINITDEKNQRMALQKSLLEKEVLLKEIHHRVNNNLQVISSLLSIQSSYINNNQALEIFKTSQDRIRSMALLHENLYKSENIHEINIKEYIEELILQLFNSYKGLSKIESHISIADINLDISISLSIGLIINELVSNALKHAFIGRNYGEVVVELIQSHNKKVITLIIRDNGIGLPEENLLTAKKSLGLELVGTLIEQHGGTLKISRNGKTEFFIQLRVT